MRVKIVPSGRRAEHRASRAVAVAALAGLGGALVPAGARAANINWNVADGDWVNSANWNPMLVPSSTDLAFVGNAAAGSTAHVISDVPDAFGVFVFNGNVVSVESGGDLNVANNSTSALDGLRVGDGFALTTPAEGTGSAVVTGTGRLGSSSTGTGLTTAHDIRVGVDGGTGTLTVNGAGALVSAGRDLRIGEDNTVPAAEGGRTGSVGTVNHSAGEISAPSGWVDVGVKGTGFYNLSGTGRLIVGDDNVANNPATGRRDDTNFNVGLDGGTGTFVQDAGTLHVTSWSFIGRNGGNGTINHSGGYHGTSGWVRVAEGGGAGPSTGVYNLSGTGRLDIGNVAGGIGDNDIGDDLLAVGFGAGSTGTVNVSDSATVNVGFRIELGFDNATAVVNQSGGTVTVAGVTANPNDVETTVGFNQGSTGTYNMSGGTLNPGARLILGKFDTATGTFNQTGGTVIPGSGGVVIAQSAGNTGTYNLDGGTLRTNTVAGGAGNSTLNFDGGTLQAVADSTDWLPASIDNVNVQGGGAKFDTNGFNLTVARSLPHDPLVVGADGGLTKLGAGTLTLTAANTYNGGTNVQAGTLVAGNADALGTGPLTVANGATARAQAGLPKALDVSAPVGITASGTTGGTLNLTNNGLVVRHANQSAAFAGHTTVNNLVRNAFNEFQWNQPGVTSSTVAADVAAGIPAAVGILLNNDGGGNALFYGDGTALPQFEGRSVDGNSVLVKDTLLGDGDLNGTVDSVDFALFQAGYTGAAPYVGFAFGDYDYNGVIDSVDFGLFQAGYQYSQSNPTPEMIAFADEHHLSLVAAAVPEPATFGVFGLTAFGLLTRRRHHHHRRQPR